MKKILFLLFAGLMMTMNIFSQLLADLDRDPSFKGITIGAPISKYSEILTYSHTASGKTVYRVKDSKFLSIFNVKMQDMVVVQKDGKVYAIQITKTYPSDTSGANIFNADELLSWAANLKSKYGNFVSLDNLSGDPAVCGMRWNARNVILDIVYLFYGTMASERPKLQYTLYQREDDY